MASAGMRLGHLGHVDGLFRLGRLPRPSGVATSAIALAVVLDPALMVVHAMWTATGTYNRWSSRCSAAVGRQCHGGTADDGSCAGMCQRHSGGAVGGGHAGLPSSTMVARLVAPVFSLLCSDGAGGNPSHLGTTSVAHTCVMCFLEGDVEHLYCGH
jgi:hypothetical protein